MNKKKAGRIEPSLIFLPTFCNAEMWQGLLFVVSITLKPIAKLHELYLALSKMRWEESSYLPPNSISEKQKILEEYPNI